MENTFDLIRILMYKKKKEKKGHEIKFKFKVALYNFHANPVHSRKFTPRRVNRGIVYDSRISIPISLKKKKQKKIVPRRVEP